MRDSLPTFLIQDKDIRTLYDSHGNLVYAIETVVSALSDNANSPRDIDFIRIVREKLSPPSLSLIRTISILLEDAKRLSEERDWVEEYRTKGSWLDRVFPQSYNFDEILDRIVHTEYTDNVDAAKKTLEKFAKHYASRLSEISLQKSRDSAGTILNLSYSIRDFTTEMLERSLEDFRNTMPLTSVGIVSVNMFKIILAQNAYYSRYHLVIAEKRRGKQREEEAGEEIDITALLTR